MPRILSLLTLLLLTACEPGILPYRSDLEPGEWAITLYVEAHTVACQGEGITRCMLVRESPTGTWGNFYGGIEGFDYRSGFRYTLSVAVREVPNPPADGSSRAYRLLEIVGREPR